MRLILRRRARLVAREDSGDESINHESQRLERRVAAKPLRDARGPDGVVLVRENDVLLRSKVAVDGTWGDVRCCCDPFHGHVRVSVGVEKIEGDLLDETHRGVSLSLAQPDDGGVFTHATSVAEVTMTRALDSDCHDS